MGGARAQRRLDRRQSARVRACKPGDRVVSYMPNIPETIAAFLATASVGAIWSSCSPDMGSGAVLDRFRQIEPKVLFAVDGYRYGGKAFDRRPVLAEIVAQLPTLARVVFLPYLDPAARLPGAATYASLLEADAPLAFEQVPFDHPLWIVYSSGTTGVPKAIVHGHGGVVIEHLKTLPAPPGPARGRPLLLDVEHRLDRVEPAGERPARGLHAGDLRRPPGVAGRGRDLARHR